MTEDFLKLAAVTKKVLSWLKYVIIYGLKDNLCFHQKSSKQF